MTHVGGFDFLMKGQAIVVVACGFQDGGKMFSEKRVGGGEHIGVYVSGEPSLDGGSSVTRLNRELEVRSMVGIALFDHGEICNKKVREMQGEGKRIGGMITVKCSRGAAELSRSTCEAI